ncbi:MAG: glycosyltransferase family 2 protein, partial [Mariniphaga sp.]
MSNSNKESNEVGLLSLLPRPPAGKTGWPWTEETGINTYNAENKWNKISIITPSYNQGPYLETTIRSVLLQNYPNLEYIIIDGGSTDNSLEIIKKYEPWITYWISEKDNGQSHAINKGFNKLTGDIVAWINSDDWYADGSFGRIAQCFKNDQTNIVLGHCLIHYADKVHKNHIVKLNKINFLSLLKYWNPVFSPPQPSIFFTAKCLKSVGFLDENLHYAMDLDLWLRITKNSDFQYLGFVLSNYLIHAVSKSGSTNGFEKFIPEWNPVFSPPQPSIFFTAKC